MDVRLAMIVWNRNQSIWELRLGAGADWPDGKVLQLEGFSSIHSSEDLERVRLILASWGVTSLEGHWEDRDGTWVVPVQQQR